MKTATESLSGRRALVTGAGEGIGKAAALLLARRGVEVALLGRTRDELEKTAREIEASKGTAVVVVADIGETEPMRAAYEELRRRWGRVDIVFANAGINGVWAGLEELEVEDWDQTLRVNLRGTFLTVKFAVPLMKTHGGSIIVTSSVNGTRMFSNTGASAYATSKAGQVAFARMCALELAPYRIRINTICPGAIKTRIDENTEHRESSDELRLPVKFPEGAIPLTDGRPGHADQVAELVAFLASDASAHITGTEVFIDGGQSLLQG
ncbi:MAG TPA: SDR family NAD(P)-dependent oxidoreductase [Candidatus Synoicihabitans sp.]|nr:SDR family NAD(P)-dependent oxidoreductase [Candidatus Synoicihabitans sp.]